VGEIITKRIGRSHIAWFESSNSWIRFEEPAWLVFSMIQAGKGNLEISRKCQDTFGFSENECDSFILDVKKRVGQLKKEKNIPPNGLMPGSSELPAINPYSVRYYTFGKISFCIHYASRLLEYYIHSPLAHLETGASGPGNDRVSNSDDSRSPFKDFKTQSGDPSIAPTAPRSQMTVEEEFKLLEDPDSTLFLHCLKADKKYSFSEYGRLKMRMFIELTKLIHRMQDEDWMAIIHASAVTDGRQSILFAADSGAGKSTLATLLQSRDLKLIADDFVPIDKDSGNAHPFPAAASVKAAGRHVIEDYDPLLFLNAYSASGTESSPVYFLPPRHEMNAIPGPVPVRAIVFLKYNPNVPCNFSALDPIIAIERIHEHAWVSKRAKDVRVLMDWLSDISFYEMEYSDTDRGMDQVESLFNNQKEKEVQTKQANHEAV